MIPYNRSPIFLLIACLVISGCRKEMEIAETSHVKPTVYTVNYPLAYFAERIGGDAVEVVFPEIIGDPAYWEPTTKDLLDSQKADHILLNGASYAKWVAKVSLPQNRLVDTSTEFRDQLITIQGDSSHSHGLGGEHSHGQTAFTTWLDPIQAIQQAAAIQTCLSVPQDGYENLRKDLLDLHDQWEAAFKKLSGQALLGSHPVYQYLERRYNLNMISVHWEPDVIPAESEWDALQAILKNHPARIMLWENQPLPEITERLHVMGIEGIVFNPCGNRPEEGDFLSVMKQNLLNLNSIIVGEL
jgi:zinc transport system substrate-binding protein